MQLQLEITDQRNLEHERRHESMLHVSLKALIARLWESYHVQSVKGKRNQHPKINSYHLTRQRHGNGISLPVPILSLPHHFSARFLMIQTALCCQPFL